MNLTLCPECGEDVLLSQYDFHFDMCYACVEERERELFEMEKHDDEDYPYSDYFYDNEDDD